VSWSVTQINAGTLPASYSYSFGSVPGEVWIWGLLASNPTTITLSGISPPNRAKLILGSSGLYDVNITNGSKTAAVPVPDTVPLDLRPVVALVDVMCLSATDMAIVATPLMNGASGLSLNWSANLGVWT
jgi:hypothetical protein